MQDDAKALRERLEKAGIAPKALADLLWAEIEADLGRLLDRRMQELDRRFSDLANLLYVLDARLDGAEKVRDRNREQRLRDAVVGGLAVNWKEFPAGKESAQAVADLADRLVAAVLRNER